MTRSIRPWTSGNTAPSAGRLVPRLPRLLLSVFRCRYGDVVPLDPACPSWSYLPRRRLSPLRPSTAFFISLRPPSLGARTHTQQIIPSHTTYHHVARNPSVATILRRGFRNFVCSTNQRQLPSALLLLQSARVYVNSRSKFHSSYDRISSQQSPDSCFFFKFYIILFAPSIERKFRRP